MLARIASALVLIPLTLAAVYFASRPVLFLILGLLGSVCMYEYTAIMRKLEAAGQPWFAYAGFWFLLAALDMESVRLAASLSGLVLAAFLAALGRRSAILDRVRGLMADLLGIVYLAFCLYPALPLRFDFGQQPGLAWIVILLVTIWAGDIAALLVGRRFGRIKLSAAVSPHKTVEGAVAGLIAGTATALLVHFLLFGLLHTSHVVIGSLLVGASGQLGDLSESMLKRAAGMKDSSNLIPGHGGILDRVDSLLFSLPALYLYLLRVYPG